MISIVLVIILSLSPLLLATTLADSSSVLAQQRLHFSASELVEAGIQPYLAERYLPWLNAYAEQYGMTTKLRKAHFLAQLAYESGGFRWSEELASGAQYEWRRDLGNTVAGDGRRFKGRGL